jgi:hypothetical protein
LNFVPSSQAFLAGSISRVVQFNCVLAGVRQFVIVVIGLRKISRGWVNLAWCGRAS